MAVKYKFPYSGEFPYPGDEVWYIESYNGRPLYTGKDKVQMVGFTTRSVQIKLRDHRSFGKTFTWGKNVFATEAECEAEFEKLKEETK